MKRIFIFLVAIFCIQTGYAQTRILPLGESTTAANPGWRKKMYDLMIANGKSINMVGPETNGATTWDSDHAGYIGWSSDGLVKKVEAFYSSNPADIVLILEGTNDCGWKWVNDNGTTVHLSALIDKVCERYPNAKVLVSSIPPMANHAYTGAPSNTPSGLARTNAEKFNAALPNLCATKAAQGKNVTYIDGSNGLTVAHLDATDGVHLNSSGNEKIGINFYNLVKDHVGTTTPPPTLRAADNPASTLAGLDYKYYEGNWSVLPNFDVLTAAKQGNVTNFDLTPRNRNDNFGFKFSGYVNVPSDGTYTFYTSSDDGSKLYIGSTEVVNNDDLHGNQERSGSIGLKAGKHAITVVYFEAGGGEVLSVSYSSSSIAKTTIPASALSRSSSSLTGNFGFENDFTGWTTYGTASINTANVRSGSKSGYFNGVGESAGANFELTGLSPNTTYQVKAWVKAVSGSDIWITAAAEGGSQVGQQMTPTSWTQSGNNIVFTTGDNVTKARISAWVDAGSSAYFDDFTVEPCSTCRLSAEVENNQQNESLTLQLHPNPTSNEVSISLAGFERESVVQLQMRDMSGKSFLRRQVKPRVEGKQVSLSVGHLPQGLFFVTVQGSKVGKTAKLIITK